jgi:hypothetical protein
MPARQAAPDGAAAAGGDAKKPIHAHVRRRSKIRRGAGALTCASEREGRMRMKFSFTMSKNDHIAVKVSRKLSDQLNWRWIAMRTYR